MREDHEDLKDRTPVNRYDPSDRVTQPSVLRAGPLKVAAYRVRDPETNEWSSLQFHMTYDNTVMAVMGENAAKLFADFVDVTLNGHRRDEPESK